MAGQQAAVHLGVAVDARLGGVAFLLDAAGTYHPFADDGTGLAGAGVRHLLERQGSDLYLQVYAVQQGAGDAVQVALHLSGRADAGLGGVVVVAAGTQV